MPFLKSFISTARHESVYNAFTKQEAKIRVQIPFQGMQESILKCYSLQEATDNTDNNETDFSLRIGLHVGDTIDLAGKSNSDKMFVLSKIIEYTVSKTPSHVIYIDLNGREESTRMTQHAQFHLFWDDPDSTSSLEGWLEKHADVHVLWVMVNGALSVSDIKRLRHAQKKWPFVLCTTDYSSGDVDFRFDLLTIKRNNNEQQQLLQMQLIWPIQMDPFIIKDN